MSNVKKFKPQRPMPTGPLTVGGDRITRDMLTLGQKEADDKFRDWFFTKKCKKNQILRIGGGAGSGKTFLLRYLVDRYGFRADDCYIMAYTGQAVNVLRKGGVLANTIHATIMLPREEPVINKKTHQPIYRNGIPLTTVKFKPIKRIPPEVRLLIVDEASFLPESLENILKGYNVPILEVGDPIQLPPVADKQIFRMDNLDFFMEGVMRQHADSELYDFATRLRKRLNVDTTQYHDEVLFLYAQPTIEETFYRFFPFFKNADMILTCTNKQRQIINDLYRKEIIGTDSPFPREGERMICRKNNRNLMLGDYILTNGTQGVCMYGVGKSMVDKAAKIFYMDFQPDVVADSDLYYDNLICDTEFLMHPVGSDRLTSFKHPGEKFEYAHAITTHLAQGAQADTVLYLDAFFPDDDYQSRIRYTAATRAKKRLIYVIPYTQYPGWCDLRNIESRHTIKESQEGV